MADDPFALARALMPYATRNVVEGQQRGLRFVHYTSAEVGLLIAKAGHISLRNASAMNDFSEIEHGQYCLETALREGPGLDQAKKRS